MENVTPMPATTKTPTKDELEECFEEAKALADVIWGIDTGNLGDDTASRLGLMLLTRIRQAEELTFELLATTERVVRSWRTRIPSLGNAVLSRCAG